MKNSLISLLVGIILGGGGVWYLSGDDPAPRFEEVGRRVETAAESVGETGVAAARSARDILTAKLDALELEPAKIAEEMTRTGQVVRRRTREFGDVVVEATADVRITAAIKAALLRDPELSVWAIAVSTTDGRVTLSGDVSSTEHVGRAILVAYEIEGVREVISTLRVSEPR